MGQPPDADDAQPRPPGEDARVSGPEAEAPTAEGLPPAGPGATIAGRPARIGQYRIIGTLGQGGMGVVYEAEQQQPKRSVALKVIRGGSFVDERRVTMFRREIETLARLEHPNIGAIYDAGRTEHGEHFFAMELVRGRTLDAYLRARTAPLDAEEIRFRLRLFVSICQAVHYAHQRGVIHRDLKPSNIVVPDRAGPPGSAPATAPLPTVKVLDFGLARITDADVEASAITEIGTLKGTLPYMSPEQARGNPLEIDLRSDVYSLGIVLYESLVGVRPYRTESTSVVDAVRVVCEQAPAPLRQHWTGTRPPDTDLQTIVGKALEKDPDRRYASAAALADDLELYLDSRPILARAPSTIYQLRKFARRNRALVAGVAATFVALLAGVAASTTFALREAAERRTAEAARRDLQAVVEFQRSMLDGIDVRRLGAGLGRDLRARLDKQLRDGKVPADAARADLARLDAALAPINLTDTALALLDDAVLTRAADTALQRFADQPAVAADLLRSIGATYQKLGLFERAVPQLLRARGLSEQAHGADALPTLDVLQTLGTVYVELGRFEDAEPLLTAVLEARRRLLPPDDDRVFTAMNDLATLYGDMERLDESLALFETAVKGYRAKHGADDAYGLSLMSNYGWYLVRAGRHEQAESILVPALAGRRRVQGNDDPETMDTLNNLAVLYRRMGKLDLAEPLYLEDLQTSRRLLGEDHPDLLVTMTNLGRLYISAGRFAEAEAMLAKAAATSRRVMPPGYYGTGFTLQALGDALIGLERFRDAEAALLDSHAILLKAFGRGGEALERPVTSLVRLYGLTGEAGKAEAWRRSLPAR